MEWRKYPRYRSVGSLNLMEMPFVETWQALLEVLKIVSLLGSKTEIDYILSCFQLKNQKQTDAM
ncbi:hypothetical protein [Candidatus Electronema sp. PJ]|uniref:hypothetical protein n=1 Tax=Candidatus Electronema sp. PJ TaxID=3401572 RepID=UPI003AA81C7B